MCKCVNSVLDAEILINDLKKFDDWAKTWQMQFNKDKCVVMHIGRSNNKFEYELGDTSLKKSSKERDLDLDLVDTSLKFSEQCNVAIKNANCTLGLISRNIKRTRIRTSL